MRAVGLRTTLCAWPDPYGRAVGTDGVRKAAGRAMHPGPSNPTAAVCREERSVPEHSHPPAVFYSHYTKFRVASALRVKAEGGLCKNKKEKKKKKGRQRTEKWLSVSYLWLFHRPLRGCFIQGHSQSCLWTPLCRELGVQPDLLFTHPSPVWQRTELPHGVGWEEGRWVRGRLCCRGDVRRCPWAQHCAPITCSLGTPFSLLHQKPLLLFFLLWQWDAQHGWCSSPTTGVGCTVPAGRQHLGQHCHSHTPWISEQKHCFHVHGVSSEEIFL